MKLIRKIRQFKNIDITLYLKRIQLRLDLHIDTIEIGISLSTINTYIGGKKAKTVKEFIDISINLIVLSFTIRIILHKDSYNRPCIGWWLTLKDDNKDGILYPSYYKRYKIIKAELNRIVLKKSLNYKITDRYIHNVLKGYYPFTNYNRLEFELDEEIYEDNYECVKSNIKGTNKSEQI